MAELVEPVAAYTAPVAAELARLTQALAAGDTLYLAMFNEKPTGAIWARRTATT